MKGLDRLMRKIWRRRFIEDWDWYCTWCGQEMDMFDTPWLEETGIGHAICPGQEYQKTRPRKFDAFTGSSI